MNRCSSLSKVYEDSSIPANDAWNNGISINLSMYHNVLIEFLGARDGHVSL